MVVSRKAKEAIKTALAMTLSYGIALQMGFDKPMWAGFAVAFISLATVGSSLNKGAMRMLGTVVAFFVALTIMALSIQNRWLFILLVSSWVGLCTYMMNGAKNQYFWNVGGFVCVIICMDAGPDAVDAFEIAILRLEESGLGILIYSLVALFLWPSHTGPAFETATRKLASTQRQLFKAYLGLMSRKGNGGETQPLRAQALQEQTQFAQLLNAAETDSPEVGEVRREWRFYQQQSKELTETMERWQEGLPELQALEVQRLLPGLSVFGAELDLRFAQIDGMLAGQGPERYPATVDLALDMAEVSTLSHFQKAGLALARTRLQHLESLTRSLFDTLCRIKDFGPPAAVTRTAPATPAGFVIDPDRAAGLVRIMVTLWLAYLALIYVDSIPGGPSLLSMAAAVGMAMTAIPQIPVSKLFLPVGFGILVAGLAYILVMPQLSSFLGLGLLLFVVTFFFCYLFANPRQALGRAFGLAMFVSIASISNQQSYSFLVVASTALMFALIFLVLSFTAYIPFSPCPERAFLRLLCRFFRSGEFLIASLGRDSQERMTGLTRWRKAFHQREVATLPGKLGVWARFIPIKALPGTSPEQVQALVGVLQTLSRRMEELLDEQGKPQAQFLVQELQEDVRAWRLRVEEGFQLLAIDPAAEVEGAFRTRLKEITDRLEIRIKETLDKTSEGQLTNEDGENFYRLLGAYRSLSMALSDYAGKVGAMARAPWREARFSL